MPKRPCLACLFTLFITGTCLAPAHAEGEARTRDWWQFQGNEYWNLFFPGWGKGREKPATIREVKGDRVLTIQPHDQPITVGVYGGNRLQTISLLREMQRIDFEVALESGPAMQVVLTLRDAAGEKWRFVPKTLDADTATLTWDYPKDVEAIYHGDPKNKTIDDALHLFNIKYIRPASNTESRVVFKNATVTEYIPATEAVAVSLRTSATYPVVYKPEASGAAIVVENTGTTAKQGRLLAKVVERDGTKTQQEYPFNLKPGASTDYPLTLGLQTFGIKTLHTTVFVDDDQRTDTTDFAYFDPVGNTGGREDPFGFWIGGAESETDYAMMAAIGVEGIRVGGNWAHRERKPGTFTWDRTDEEVEAFARHGFDMQYLVSYGHPAYAREPWATELKGKRWPLQTSPPQIEAWNRWLRELATRYDGQITMFEIWNEPDLASFWKGSTDDYIQLLRESHRVLKDVNPDNVVMTAGFATATYHGGHALNPDMQERVLNEAADFFDIHTHHQHGRFRGFMTALDGPLARWRSGPASTKPLVLNETALSYKQAGGEWEQAEELVKKMSFAFARGAKAYAWFVFYGGGKGHISEFAMVHGPENQPRPALVAYNELARQLRDTRFVEQIDADSGRLILRFAEPEGNTERFVVWHENDNTPVRPIMLRVPDGATVTRTDLMGNTRPIAVHDGVVSFEVGATPAYLSVTTPGDTGLAVLPPLLTLATDAVTVDEDQRGIARLVLNNPTDTPASVTLSYQLTGRPAAEQTVQLAAGESRQASLELHVEPSPDAPTLRVLARLDPLGLEQSLVVPVVAARALTADPIDSRDPDFVIAHADDVVNYFMNDPANLHKNWAGPEDISARLWLSPTDAGLRILVHATDDTHQQNRGPGQLWQMDSLQVGVAGIRQDGFYEIGAALHSNGKVLRRVFKTPAGQRLDLKAMPMTVQRVGDQTRYDLTVPWAAFGANRPSGIRFSLVVNDSDEGAREGLIRLSPGIDQGKDPSLFPVLSLPAND